MNQVRESNKSQATLIISSFAILQSLSSSTPSPSLPSIARSFNITNGVEQTLVLSIFQLGLSFGPFALAPISELYGRFWIVQGASIWFMIWNLACGFSQSSTQLIIFRLFAGIGGTASVLGGGVLSDVWLPHQRGRGLSVYSLAPNLGPALGPLLGGWIAEYSTWRWGFWSVAAANAAVQFTTFIWLRETYAPKLLADKAARLRQETGNMDLHTEWDDPDRTIFALWRRNFKRPWKLFFTQPIVLVLGVYNAYNYGLLYLFISTFPRLWEDVYHESTGIAGLNFISLALGSLFASQICAPTNDHIYKRLKKRFGYADEQEGVPEFRVPLMLLGAILNPIGLLWYGWSAEAKVFWLMPNIGVFLYAAGSLLCYQCIQVYIVDAYTSYAASAFAASTLLRSLSSFGFPLFAPYIVQGLGYGFEGVLLAGIAIVIGIPTPFVMWKYGARIRAKSRFCAGNTVQT